MAEQTEKPPPKIIKVGSASEQNREGAIVVKRVAVQLGPTGEKIMGDRKQ